MLYTSIARFAATAAFVGGFGLVGQSTAQADDGTSETLSGVTSHTDVGTQVNDGDGDDASNTQSVDTGDNIAIGTDANVTVGDVCVIATCESTQTVTDDINNATSDVEQGAVTIGGDGGDGGTTQSADTGDNIAIGTDSNVAVGDVCVIPTCESTQTVTNDINNATTDVEQEAVTIGGEGGEGTSPRKAEDHETAGSGHGDRCPCRDEAEPKDERTRDGSKRPGSGTDSKADTDGGDGGDAVTSQSAKAGDRIAIGAGNDVTSGNACLVSTCESTHDVAHDSNNAATDVDQEAVTIGGGGGSGGGGATSPTTAGAGVSDIASPAATGFGGALGGFAGLAGIMLVLLFVIATGASRSNPARG